MNYRWFSCLIGSIINSQKNHIKRINDFSGIHEGRYSERVKSAKPLIRRGLKKNEADGNRTRNIQIDSLVL